MTLAELAQAAEDSVENYAEAASKALDGFLDVAEERGAAFAFLRCAAHGAAACEHWWNHPRWPAHVDAFIAEVSDLGSKYFDRLGPRPAQIEDSEEMRSQMLSCPWELDSDSAQWIVYAGISYVMLKASPRLVANYAERWRSGPGLPAWRAIETWRRRLVWLVTVKHGDVFAVTTPVAHSAYVITGRWKVASVARFVFRGPSFSGPRN